MDSKINKSGQVTIFIIIAIIIIAVVLLFLFLYNREPSPGEKPSQNPESFLDSCMKEQLKEAVNEITKQGGFTEHNVYITFGFLDEDQAYDIEYLCYQNQDYLPCVNQEPMLFHHLEGEIGKYIEGDIITCWNALGQKLEGEGYVVDATRRGYDVVLRENQIAIPIDGTMILTKSGEVTREDKFTVRLTSKLYYLIKAAQEIVSSEAKTCNFNYANYMLVYPDLSVERFTTGDGDKIYTVTHRETGEMFRFAVRGCIFPPGY